MGKTYPQFAFLLAWETLGQPLGDQQPQNTVADKFETLVRPRPFARTLRVACRGAVGQCLTQQSRGRKYVTEYGLPALKPFL